ncbi:MAG TPA: hypothetical protein VFS12_05700, partial [Terriglobia bacterium]|nr:hypothetical protein [Terriglobia bacterium]
VVGHDDVITVHVTQGDRSGRGARRAECWASPQVFPAVVQVHLIDLVAESIEKTWPRDSAVGIVPSPPAWITSLDS